MLYQPKVNTQKLTRQLVVKGQVTDVRMQAINNNMKQLKKLN